MEDVSVWLASGQVLLDAIGWRVRPGEHWVVIGPNGAGKSTLLALAGAQRHPSGGAVHVLGRRMGRVDVRELRTHIGFVGTTQRLLDDERASAHTVVLTGHSGTVQPLWDRYDARVLARAHELLDTLGCAHIAERPITVCSQGERARVRLARALLTDPALLLLDEPFAGLDLAAREDLVTGITDLAAADPRLATVTVTHHLEEVPAATTHALLLGAGRILGTGKIADVLTDEALSRLFDRELRVTQIGDRWAAHAAAREHPLAP